MEKFIITKPYEIQIVNEDIPKPGKNEVVIKVKACGICATDVHTYEGEMIFKDRYPFYPGHEVAGDVYQVGKEVSNLCPGDKVVIDPMYPCGHCFYCQKNKENYCLNLRTIGLTGPGGFSEFIRVPVQNVYKFEEIDYTTAAFAEPLATVLYGLSRTPVQYGDRVLINGAGPLGLLHLQMILLSGVSEVTVTDLNPVKLQTAKELGADRLVLVSRKDVKEKLKDLTGFGFDLIIDATGQGKVVEESIPLLGMDGSLLVFGVCSQNEDIRVNPYDIYRRDLKILGAFSLKKTMASAVKLLVAGKVKTDKLLAGTVTRSEIEGVLGKMKQGNYNGKVQIVPEYKK